MPRHEENPGKREGAAARRVKAFDLRVRGLSYRKIGKELGVSQVTAFKDVQHGMEELAKMEAQKAEDVRRLELQRLDTAVEGLMCKVEFGDTKAIMALVRCMDRRAKLLGLDAPTRVAHSGDDEAPPIQHQHTSTGEGLTDEQRIARINDLLERARRRIASPPDSGGAGGTPSVNGKTNADGAGGVSGR